MTKRPTDANIRVLLVDDDEDDYLIIKNVFMRIVDSPFELTWCSSYEEAKEYIASHSHDVYLLDYRLGKHTGLELLEFAQAHKRSEPFILLTGVGDKKIENRSMKLAAADYLVKGSFNAELLSRTLRYALERKQVEEQRVQHLIELNRTKDEFISLASHQLRTPATGVKQYVGMLLEGFMGELSDAQRTTLVKAQESNERQLRIVADLLKVAQVDAGKVHLRKEPVDINHLVSDIIKEQHVNFENRNQTVQFTPTDSSLMLELDQSTIRMVLENIIDNASKYSPENSPIQVSINEDASDVCVRVIDKGVGIKQKDHDKLFEKFSRIDNPLSTQVGGTGLGLYWAKKIIDLHMGRIEFESRPQVGTTFKVCLPKSAALDYPIL